MNQVYANPNLQVENKEAVVWSPAGFWIRAGAWIIDSILINIAMAPIAERYAAFYEEYTFRISLIYLVIWGVYGALCNIWFQGSLGKKILGLKIVDRYEGRKVSFGIIFFRDGFGRFVSLMPLGLGFVWAAFNKEKKTLHDHIFATRVVKKVPIAVYGEDEVRDITEKETF